LIPIPTSDHQSILYVIFRDGRGPLLFYQKKQQFEQNKVDYFIFEAIKLGEFGSGTITPACSRVVLDKVIIRSEIASKRWYFLCGRWFATDGKTYMPLTTCDLTIVTGGRRGAGTDANVSVCIFGSSGDLAT